MAEQQLESAPHPRKEGQMASILLNGKASSYFFANMLTETQAQIKILALIYIGHSRSIKERCLGS